MWAGWGPIILANEGFKAGKVWKAPGGQDFRVELVLIDDPVAMRNAYASGEVHIGWGTLDMVPLFVDGFAKAGDTRIMPRMYQQVDWSNGGDGIVVREHIKTVADLRGKTLVLAQNSPSQYFALNMLVAAGVQPSEVKMVYTATAFEAARAFEAQKDIAGAVSWAPDIYNLAKIKGNRLLVTTQTANKLIADVWFARADFAKDHPQIIEGLVRGIFDAMEEMKLPDQKEQCAKLMAEGYSIPVPDAMSMFGDAHNTNWAENYQFFVNQNNPTNFERIWRQAYYLYRRIGVDRESTRTVRSGHGFLADRETGQRAQVWPTEGRIPGAAGAEDGHGNPRRERRDPDQHHRHSLRTQQLGLAPPDHARNQRTESRTVVRPRRGHGPGRSRQAMGQFGAARIIIEGHTDASMKGAVPESLIKELAQNRANAVKQDLVNKYKLEPNKFSVDGVGWDRPADAQRPAESRQEPPRGNQGLSGREGMTADEGRFQRAAKASEELKVVSGGYQLGVINSANESPKPEAQEIPPAVPRRRFTALRSEIPAWQARRWAPSAWRSASRSGGA